jgi:hypothetical protein
MPAQGLHLLSQNVVAGLLAEEHEKSADGTVDQLPLLVLVLAGSAGDGLCRSGYLELLDGAFHHLRCDFAAWRLFCGALPRHVGLLWGEASQRAQLILVLGFPLRAICAEIPKRLSRSDQLSTC